MFGRAAGKMEWLEGGLAAYLGGWCAFLGEVWVVEESFLGGFPVEVRRGGEKGAFVFFFWSI